MHTRLPEHEKSSRPPPSLLDFLPCDQPRPQKKKGKKGRSQTSGCSDDRAAADSSVLHTRSALADALVEDVDEKMAKMALAPAKPDSASGTRPSPAA